MNDQDKQVNKEVPTAAENSGTQDSAWKSTDFFEIVWPHRKRIAVITSGVTVAAILIALLAMHASYIAQTTILPDVDIMNMVGKMGGLQALASAAGIGNQIVSPSQLYPDILMSERVLERVIYHRYRTESYPDGINLIQFYKYDDEDSVYNYEQCLKDLRKDIITIDVDRKTTIITLTVTTKEKQLSADIANQITAELDDYQRNFRRTNASEQRKFLEQRLTEVKEELTKSEEKLKDFREKNRRVEQSPQLMLEQGRLERDVELNSTLFIQLTSQYDLAKLDEIKNTPVVQVLDVGRAPSERSRQGKRRVMVLGAAFLTLLCSSGWYVLINRLNQLRRENEEFARICGALGESFIRAKSKVRKVLPWSSARRQGQA
jgi:uncharacterized protein involved in exopolysaccharide biosynthesis